MPGREADEAELVITAADHVVAALGLLDEHGAFGAAFPLLKINFKVLVALPTLVASHHALLAEYGSTLFALWRQFSHVDYSLIA